MEDVKAVINSILDSIEADDMQTTRSKTTRSSSSGLSTRSTPTMLRNRGANTVVKTDDPSHSLRLTSYGDNRSEDRRVAEVTPVLPDKIPEDLQKTHEAGEVTITILTESVLLKLDDKPPVVLLGASNPINIKIRWPKDKAIQTRLENLIQLVEKNDWPSSKPAVPTISLPPNHLTGTLNNMSNLSSTSPSKSDKELAPSSPTSDTSNLSSRPPREPKEPIVEAPVTRGRRGKGRRPRQPESETQTPSTPKAPVEQELPRDDRNATAKLRNLLSQGTSSSPSRQTLSSSSMNSTEKMSSKFPNVEKQGAGLSSLLASGKQKRSDTASTSRSSRNEEPRNDPLLPENALAGAANLLPQILANLKPELRDSSFAALLSNPDTVSLLLNSITGAGGSLSANLPPRSTASSNLPQSQLQSDNSYSASSRSSSKSQRNAEKMAMKLNTEKQQAATAAAAASSSAASNLPSLLASFNKQQQRGMSSSSSSSSRAREEKNIMDQATAAAAAAAASNPAPNPMNLLPQILANMKPEFRDLLANQDAASIFNMINSLGNFNGAPNLGANMRPNVSNAQMPMDTLLSQTRPSTSSSKGPPPAHQRSDNAPAAAHGSSARELRRNSQNTSRADSPSASTKNTRGKSSMSSLEALEQQKQAEAALARSSSGKRRGRPSSSNNDSPPGSAPGADILDLSSLPLTRKGNSLLRSESRSRRHRDIPDEPLSVSTRSSTSNIPTRSSSKSSSSARQQESEPPLEQQSSSSNSMSDKGGRTTRASKRIGSRIDALALNLQAKRLHRSDSPELPSPSSHPKERDNQMAAHGKSSSSGDQKSQQSSKSSAPPAAHSGSHKSSSSSSNTPMDQSKQSHRHRDKTATSTPSSQPTSTMNTATPTTSSSRPPAPQDPIAQLMSKLSVPQATSSAASSMPTQAMPSQSRQDPLAQLMSNPANLLASLNPAALGAAAAAAGAGAPGGGAGDIMNQLLRKAGTNDIVKTLLNEFVKNPSLAPNLLDPNILATLTASLPMGTQSMPSFNLPTSAATSLPYGNFTNPLANPFLPFGMANLGMNNPLSNPLGMFPNLYMPTTRFPGATDQQQQQQPQQQQQQSQQPQQQQRRPSSQSGVASDSSSKDKKMRYPRK